MQKSKVAISLGIMCFILVFGIVLQINTIKEAVSTVGQSGRENNLKDGVLEWKEKYDKTYESLQNAEKQLEDERKISISTDSSSVEKQEELKELNTYLGLTDVVGEGVIITVKDNTNSVLGTAADIVHDGDLRALVNEIKNHNAEAISINGQRIVQTTSITCAGALTQINNEPVGSPFIIKVIGDKNTLYNNLLRPGSYLNRLEEVGIYVDIERSDDITVEKYKGVLTDKYIKNVE